MEGMDMGAVISAASALLTAIIGGLLARDARRRKKQDERAAARERLRIEESGLSMGLMSATMSLCEANAIALKNGRTNGETEAALKAAAEARRKYYSFINGVAAGEIAAE